MRGADAKRAGRRPHSGGPRFTAALRVAHAGVTGCGNSVRMTRLRLMLAVVGAALAAASSAFGVTGLPPGWSHAEINVFINGQPHTLVLDRGRVRAVSPTGLVLRERDGSVVTIRLNARTKVRLDGIRTTIGAIQVRDQATTERIDGGAARSVHASSR